MIRQISACILVTLAAPYLVTCSLLIVGPWPELLGPREFQQAMTVGTVGLAFYGLPVFLASACVFVAFRQFGFGAWPWHILGGTVIGFLTIQVVTWQMNNALTVLVLGAGPSPKETLVIWAVGSCVGAISGWISWAMTMGGRHSRTIGDR